MKVLITGGLGYVGGRLADRLSRRAGCTVALTDLPPKAGLPPWAAGFEFHSADVTDKKTLAGVFSAAKADTVIHLAALNDAQCEADPESAIDVNVRGTYNVLEAASASDAARIVYFSTFHVYGPGAGSDITEATPAMPAHPYATTHRAAEDLVRYFRHYRKLKTLIFRMSNSFGCPMDLGGNAWTLVFNDLCRQLQTAGFITLKSAGTQHRDFIPLSDAAGAVEYFLLDREDWGAGLYNLGGGSSMSILDAARRVERVFKAKYGRAPGPMKTGPAVPGAAPVPVNYSIGRLLASGFTPSGDMDGEIERTLALCEGFR